jgi:hypothetical protein
MMKRTLCCRSSIQRGQGVELPRGEIISPKGYQFYTDWSRLNRLFENSMKGLHVYCKGAVHEGKSSFAKSYAEDLKNNACFLPCNELDHLAPPLVDRSRRPCHRCGGCRPRSAAHCCYGCGTHYRRYFLCLCVLLYLC